VKGSGAGCSSPDSEINLSVSYVSVAGCTCDGEERAAVTIIPPEPSGNVLGVISEYYMGEYPPPPDCIKPVSVVETWAITY